MASRKSSSSRVRKNSGPAPRHHVGHIQHVVDVAKRVSQSQANTHLEASVWEPEVSSEQLHTPDVLTATSYSAAPLPTIAFSALAATCLIESFGSLSNCSR